LIVIRLLQTGRSSGALSLIVIRLLQTGRSSGALEGMELQICGGEATLEANC
jgi:hypothetical protein